MQNKEFTKKAKSNFQISGITAPVVFIEALGTVKLAAIETNASLGLLDKKKAVKMTKACKEFIEGKHNSDFTIDIFQAGAGTSYNMNANEIIADLANVHPNDHVNMGQSTNDVIPTATRLAVLFSLPSLLSELAQTEKELGKIAKKHQKIIKVGRTHLQDAVPISLGQEFDSYREALKKSRIFIELMAESLQELAIGGTAVGTGLNAHPRYHSLMLKNLGKITGIKFHSAKNFTEIANNMNSFMNFSSALRSLATNLLNIIGDLKLMNMGPKAGLAEITLPAVQPGSSIMPGKVNPSIPEAVEMVCLQVLGNDKTIELACQKSHFELNVFCPIIMYNLLQSTSILSTGLKTLREKALYNLQINTKRIDELLNNSHCCATALAPHIGYDQTAEIVKKAKKNGSSIKEEVLKSKVLTEKEFDKIIKKSS